ncbi:DNA-binding protein HU, putative [Thermogutta terrifontis]|jgi:nucleoid DNA-binding protein|uniref:DNA-binding protein HU, putative n=1 Tax=Thermogutta terrifontis TaxID=1331910 RepID=A0A286RGW7_9BACT|nr:HU family DNA-binding protein [Thermogutta terrifontis]ASV75182.1 DNA-binding protein HU, putative [Thermogutta terrifontis]
MAKDTAEKKPLTKTQLVKALAEATGLKKADVEAVLNALTEEVKKALSPRGPGAFVLPGLLKIKKAKTKPTPARQMPKPGKPDEIITIPAKPARNVVRIRALKQLKEMV